MIALTASRALAFACTSFLLAADISSAQAIPEPTPQPSCDITNVCFVIDESGSINSAQFQQELDFVGLIATEIKTINPPTRLSAIAFSTSVQDVAEPTDDLASFIATVDAHTQAGGSTNMGPALDSCRQKLEPLSGNRVIIFHSDGSPSDRQNAIDAAARVRNAEDMYVVTVAIGNAGADFLENFVAHSPEFAVEGDFDTLPDEVENVIDNICEVIEPTDEPTDDNCGDAYNDCLFKFEGEAGLTKYNMMPLNPDQSFTPIIVPKDPKKRIGVLNTNGITPEFILLTGPAPITDFGSQRFTPTHFKPFWMNEDFGSGIGHQTFQSDQAEIGKDKCIRVYFTSFQVLENVNGNFVVVDNRNGVPRSENKCVVFQTE